MRRLRAVVIAIFLLANGIQAIPYAKMEAENVHDPTYRAGDIDNFYAWLGPVLPWDRERFGEIARRAVWSAHETVRMLRIPTEPFFDATHTGQQWGLFAIVTQRPDGVVVEVRRDKEWETLYRRLDGEHTWRDAQLKYRRIRGVWDGVKEEPKGTYKRMSIWIAEEVFREQPDVDRVRVVLERKVLTYPWEPVDPNVTRRAERYHKREEMGL